MEFISLSMMLGLLLAGAVVGFLSGLLGIGGGVLIIPTLLWLLSHTDVDDSVLTQVVFGTSLLVGATTALSGALAHRRQVTIYWDVVLTLAVGSILGAQAGGYAAHILPGELLQRVFGVHLLFTAFMMMRPAGRGVSREPMISCNRWFLVFVGFIIGSLSALLGIGGAIISTAILVLVLKYPIHNTLGTSASLMVFTATSGAISYMFNGWNMPHLPPYSLGYVNLYLWWMLVVTSTVTAKLGAGLTHRLKPQPLQRIFGVFLLFIAARMLSGL